eukprot:IDg9395t1
MSSVIPLFCAPLHTALMHAVHRPRLSTRHPRPPRTCVRVCARPPGGSSDATQIPPMADTSNSARPRVRVSRSDDAAALAAAKRVWAAATTEPSLITDDYDEMGADDCVAVAWAGGLPVGAGRVITAGGNARIERVFVLPAWRARGTGRTL